MTERGRSSIGGAFRTTIGLLLVVCLVASTATASTVAVDTGASSSSPVDTGTALDRPDGDNTTMWAPEGTVLEDVDRFAMTNADGDGVLRIAFTRGEEIHLASVTTHGEVVGTSRVTTAVNEVTKIDVVASEDGRSHIIYRTQPDAGTHAVRHIAVTSEGSLDFEQTVRTDSERINFEDTTIGPNGRVFVISDDFDTTGIDFWALNTAEPGLNGFLETGTGADVHNPSLTVHEETLYIGFSEDHSRTAHHLQVARYDLSGATVQRSGQDDLIDNDHRIVDSRIQDLAVHPDGLLLVTYSDNDRTSLSAFDPNSGAMVTGLDGFDGFVRTDWTVDYSGRSFAFVDSQHVVFDEQLDDRRAVPFSGDSVARNGHGFPSLLTKTDDGDLRYRPMVVQALPETENPIAQYGSIDDALAQRVEELQTAASRPINISVVVRPAGGGESFQTGERAAVTVNAGDASIADIDVLFDGAVYSLDTDGSTTIPLSEPGSQELEVRYGDASETVTLTVEQAGGGQETATTGIGNSSEATDESASGDGGAPGFGLLGSLLGISLCLWAARRRVDGRQ
ncbi:hypothetical protein [Haloarchaeobius baliensis]|uniref:hypothetical protein n=1 Tax=Haloarchaeobius baliensis TaxID=1670458 RepID=UPI003F8859E8